MRHTAAATCLLCLACLAVGETAGPTATAPAEADKLAAESLIHHARHLSVLPDAPGRTIRIRASLEFARRLVGTSPEIDRMLAGICQSEGRLQDECDTLTAYVAARPRDHYMAVRWLLLRRDLVNTAEERIKLYESVIQNQAHPPALKAEALTEMSAVLEGQGHLAEARQAVERALQLDPHNIAALRARFKIHREPTRADEVDLMLGALAGSPADARMAVSLADLLQTRGLHEQALRFFKHARQVAERADRRAALLAASGLSDAMLDAGQTRQAIAVLEPLRKENPKDYDLAFKLIEALRTAGENSEAEKLIQDLSTALRPTEPSKLLSLEFAKQLTWFYLVVEPQPGLALAYARRAVNSGLAAKPGEKSHLQTLLGAAEIQSGNVKAGESRLYKVAGGDIFAAAFLTRHWYATGNEETAAKTLLAGLSMGQGGWAYRRLRELAEKHNVEIPPMKGAEEIRRKIDAFDENLLAPAAAPHDFVEVSLEPLKDKVAPGEGVMVRATLKNKGDVRLPLGLRGLFVPSLALRVAAASQKQAFSDLPVAMWPAPRYLAPGESVTMDLRADQGRLALMLCRRPLDELTLEISAMPGPTARGEELASALPSVKIEPVTVARSGLLERVKAEKRKDPAAAYEEALGWIVYDIKHGRLPARMRAARQVASLVGWSRRVENREVEVAKPLAAKVSKPVVLRMLMEVLEDSSAAVRAEAVAALCDAKLDEETLRYLAPAIEDPSPLVRMRTAELIGASETRGKETIVTFLAQDADKLVSLMASAFIKDQKSE